MVTELPKVGGMTKGCCFTCAGKIDGHCDDSVFDSYNQNRRISKYRPSNCPKNSTQVGDQSQSPEILLRMQLKR